LANAQYHPHNLRLLDSFSQGKVKALVTFRCKYNPTAIICPIIRWIANLATGHCPEKDKIAQIPQSD
jgi:hypothetical protein